MENLKIIEINLPDFTAMPHLSSVTAAYEVNDTYKVLIARSGIITHVRIRRKDDQPITNYQIFQEIKNKFIGEEKEAVQVFPKKSNYIDNYSLGMIFGYQI